ncbi:MAG: hypothetical protein LAT68_15025 [Cyclobacteriaceae bacterium]|nr:hypothetical protein [Cyclobacteriaceae bacterium]MCH8517633.1 hypothetical protein [Cyclobacteriaceae bacterium]
MAKKKNKEAKYSHESHEASNLIIGQWMRGFLLIKSFYNIAWGLFIYWFPDAFYRWASQTEQATPILVKYQGIGVVIFGVLYFLAAIKPLKYWFVPIAGFMSKFAGLAYSIVVLGGGEFNKKLVFHILMNELVWLIPLAFVAKAYISHYRQHTKK